MSRAAGGARRRRVRQNGGMNVILVGLTLLVLAGVLIACVALGSDRFAAAQHVSRDGIEVLPPARGPLEGPSWIGDEDAGAARPEDAETDSDDAAAGPEDADAGPAGAGPAATGHAAGDSADGRGGA
jgi:hypothetical protein